MTDGHGYTVPAGTVLGHEFTGEVVGIGPNVVSFAVGDRIAAMPIAGCGSCRRCLSGEPAWCTAVSYLFGGYAELALVSATTAVKLPATLSDRDGALVEPLAVALHGVAMAGLRPGARVLVQGAGPIGLAALFWAWRLGAGRVDVIEQVPARAAIAAASGATSVAGPRDVAERDSGEPADPDTMYDLVVECVGRPGLLMQALGELRPGGTIVSLGYCFAPDAIVPASAGRREARVLFPQLYTASEFRHALDVLDAGAVEPRNMVTNTVSLDGLPAAFEALRSDPTECKVLIDPFARVAGHG